MTYLDRLKQRQERATDRANRNRNLANEEATKAHAIADTIPMGQPILVGHHSEAGHRRDIGRMGRAMDRAIEAATAADDYAHRAGTLDRRAKAVEAALATAEYNAGDIVLASVTNSGWIRRFKGEVVDRTKNFYKVRALELVWDGDERGRVFRIPAEDRPGHTLNNRIIERAG